MRERAKLLGGKLSIWSELDSGTELELQIPARNAYERLPDRQRSWFAKTFSGRDAETQP
jgi:signal transduction histidine kinase